jgi:hypothetical protein
MTAVEIVVLIGTIVKELGAMVLALIAAGGTKKTPEEVRQDIKDLVDSLDDNWIAAEVKKADTTFSQRG